MIFGGDAGSASNASRSPARSNTNSSIQAIWWINPAGSLLLQLEQRLLDLPGTLESWEHYLESYPHLASKTKKIPMVHRVSTWSVSLQWAKAGLGVALAHDTIAKDLLESGELIRPLAFSMPMKEAYYLIAPEGLETHSAAHTFKQWLLAEMEKPGKGAANNKARV